MVKMFSAAVLLVIVQQSSAVIYRLNDTQYDLMPPLFGLDDYSRCMVQPGGTYCLTDVGLQGDSALMNMIRGYSEHRLKHFNHTQIHRGVCVTRTCANYLQNRSLERTEDLKQILEACINNTIWKEYQINAKIENIEYCKKANEQVPLDTSDYIVAVVILAIIMLNAIGTSYDFFLCKDKEKSGNRFLLTFSVRRNFKKLASSGGSDPRLSRLKVIHGLRAMTMIGVIFSHIPLVMCHGYIANPLYIERALDDISKQIVLNGTLVTHTFFVMSAFLLAFNFQLQTEKGPVSWILYPKGILLRWLRLTPAYALVIAVVSTWMRRAGQGALWDRIVTSESVACRQYWWAQILYVNNYIYEDAFCMPQAWYLAADMQLFCLGLFVCVAARSARARRVVLGTLLAVSIVLAALLTWLYHYDAIVIQYPESYRNLYATDDNFRHMYIRGHTNMSTYVLGLAGGFFTYYWQKNGKDLSAYKRYRWVYWAMFPTGVGIIISGFVFYFDGAPAPDWLRIIYAALYKPVFQMLVVFVMVGAIFKFESTYRSILEWKGWTWMGRVTYNAFLLHTVFQRGLIGSWSTPIVMTDYTIMMFLGGSIFLCYMCAAIMWVMVEAPVNGIVKMVMNPPKKKRDHSKEDNINKIENGGKVDNTISYISKIENTSGIEEERSRV